jgi:dienelactone hydrolase
VGGFFIKPVPSSAKPAPPAPYVHPSDFRSAEISIGTAPFVLGGTLTVPVGLGPFPGVVLVHGSGPQDRDETIGANKVFKDLAEGLASRGIEVLRYDKRTFVYGAKLGDSISVDDEVMVDAVAAVTALRARPEIDARRILVIGHSMGALLAPEIGIRSAPVAGVALLAPPGRPPWDIVLSQMRYLGASPKEITEMEQKVARLKAGTLGSERLLGAPQSYWKDLAAHDGIGMAKKLGTPVLVLRGDRDYQIVEQDVEAWRKGLAGVPNVDIVTLTGLNHLFIAGSGKPGPSEYGKPGHVDGRVIDKLAAFIAPAKKQ